MSRRQLARLYVSNSWDRLFKMYRITFGGVARLVENGFDRLQSSYVTISYGEVNGILAERFGEGFPSVRLAYGDLA